MIVTGFLLATQTGYKIKFVNTPCQQAKPLCDRCLDSIHPCNDLGCPDMVDCDAVCLQVQNKCSPEGTYQYRQWWNDEYSLDYGDRLVRVYGGKGYYNNGEDGKIVWNTDEVYWLGFFIWYLLLAIMFLYLFKTGYKIDCLGIGPCPRTSSV